MGLSLFESAQTGGLVPHITAHAPRLIPAQSVYPSTTAAGLASLAFAAPPAVHGALGYWIHFPETDQTVNMLSGKDLTGRPAPEHLLYPPLPNLFEGLAARGLRSSVVSPAAFRDSGLTRWLYHHAEYAPYDPENPHQAIGSVHECLLQGVDFIWLYWPHIDMSAHTTGIDSAETGQALRDWDDAYHHAMTLWAEHANITVMVAADHGMMALDPDQVTPHEDCRMQTIWRNRWAGERRALTSELAPDALTRALGDQAIVVPQEKAWKAGWYGGPPVQPMWRQRTLNTLILARRGAQFEQNAKADTPVLKAAHGGITNEERHIPLLIQHWGERLED